MRFLSRVSSRWSAQCSDHFEVYVMGDAVSLAVRAVLSQRLCHKHRTLQTAFLGEGGTAADPPPLLTSKEIKRLTCEPQLGLRWHIPRT